MRVTEIGLQEYADIYEGMIDREEESTGSETFYKGTHPDYDGLLFLFQNGPTDTATLIQLGAG